MGLFNFDGLHWRYVDLFNIRAAQKQPLAVCVGSVRSDSAIRRYSNTNGNAFGTEKSVGSNFNSESGLRLNILFATSRSKSCLFAVCSTHWFAVHLHLVYGQYCRTAAINNDINQNTRRSAALRNEVWRSRCTIQSILLSQDDRIDPSRLVSNENRATK